MLILLRDPKELTVLLMLSYNCDHRHITMVKKMEKTIAAAQFKARCLQLMEDVQRKHISMIITKHGVPIAKLVPLEETSINLYGALKGTIKIKADIIAPIDESWDAML